MDAVTIDWQPASTAPENVVIRTKIHDWSGERNEQLLMRRGNLWWFPDGSMYVYYRPTHWAPNMDAKARLTEIDRMLTRLRADLIMANQKMPDNWEPTELGWYIVHRASLQVPPIANGKALRRKAFEQDIRRFKL
jgi:hypothetical protein